jgi:hypothetical protein
LPSNTLHTVQIFWGLALVISHQGLTTGVAEVVAAWTSHMSTAFCLLDDLAASPTLPILLGHLQMQSYSRLAFAFMTQIKTVLAVSAFAERAKEGFSAVERTSTVRILAGFKIRIGPDVLVADYFLNF